MLAASLVVASLAAGTRPAQALVPTIPQNADDIAEWVRMGAPQSTPPPCAGATCQALVAAEQAIPDAGTGARILRQANILRTRVGLMPKVTSLFGPVSLGITSFQVGWYIGTGIRTKFFGADVPPEPPAVLHPTVRWIAAGDTAYGGSVGGPFRNRPTGDSYNLRASYDALLNYHLPYEGRYVQWQSGECDTSGYPSGSFGPAPTEGELIPGSVWLEEVTGCTKKVYDRDRTYLGMDYIPGGAIVRQPVYYPAQKAAQGRDYPPWWNPARQSSAAAPTVDPATLPARIVREVGDNPWLYPDLEAWIDNKTGGDSDDPLNPRRRVSGRTCAGVVASVCLERLRGLGFEDIGVLELDWTHAATGIERLVTTVIRYGDRGAVVPQFDPAALPDRADYPVAPMPAVLPEPLPATIPAPGTTVAIPIRTPLRVVVNPDDSPRRVLAPLPGEAYPDYVGRLQDRGLVGRTRTATDAEVDPYAGPRAVVKVAPRPNSRVRPGIDVEVVANPDATPDPAGPAPDAGGWSPPPVRAPDLGPLAGVTIGCDKFPFGVFCWMFQGLGGWGSNAQCPAFSVPIHNSSLLVDLCLFNPAMDVIRPIVGTVAAFGIAWMFAASALGFGGGKGDES